MPAHRASPPRGGHPPKPAVLSLPRPGLILWLVACLCLAPGLGSAQDILNDSFESSKQYLVVISGTAGKERFSHVRGLVTIQPSPDGARNPYIVLTAGWPTTNETNSFTWVSDSTEMETISSSVVCRIVGSASFEPLAHFYYLSPKLLKIRGMSTQHDKEVIAHARKVALPTLIRADAGELNINFLGTRVNGTVWMTGYDLIGHEHVRYQASFEGERNRGLTSKRRIGKYDR